MTTAELSAATGVPEQVIRNMAPSLKGSYAVGGRVGWVHADDAPEKLREVLLKRRERTNARRSAK